MLTLEQMRKTIPDPTLSDEEVLEIRDQLHYLAEIVFEKWQADMTKEKQRKLEEKTQKENLPAINPE